MTTPVDESASPPRYSRTRLVTAVAMVAVFAVAILLIAAFASGREPGGTSSGVKSPAEHSISAAASGRQQGKFEVVSGAESIVVRCEDTGADLYRASTPQDGRLVPEATQTGDTTQLTLVASGMRGPASAEIILNAAVTWELKMAGGGLKQTIECGAGKLSAIELGQGAGSIDVTLPAARGTMPILLSGGAGDLKIHLPKGPPVQVKIGEGAGAGSLSVDGQTTNDVKPGSELTPPDWNQAADRYMIDATSGCASLVVDRR